MTCICANGDAGRPALGGHCHLLRSAVWHVRGQALDDVGRAVALPRWGLLTLYLLDERHRRLETAVLGRDVTRGGHPQVLVPAGVQQAAQLQGETTLCSCTVALGFDFADWETPPGEALAAWYPEYAELFR